MILPAEDTCVTKNNIVVVLLISITFPETIFLWMLFLPVAWPVGDVQQFLAFLF